MATEAQKKRVSNYLDKWVKAAGSVLKVMDKPCKVSGRRISSVSYFDYSTLDPIELPAIHMYEGVREAAEILELELHEKAWGNDITSHYNTIIFFEYKGYRFYEILRKEEE